ncbi:MAG: zf-HC2 domain-containing protein [Anaerolineae bacterium]
MSWITCNHYQKLLVAFINHELPPTSRRRVASHLDTCPRCYRAYVEQQHLTRELKHVMPLVGQGTPPPFAHVWAAAHTDAKSVRRTNYTLRYSVVMLAVMLVLLIPFALDRHSYTLASAPTQPSPLLHRSTPQFTPSQAASVSVVFQLNETPPPPLQSTFTPVLPDAVTTP